MIDNAILEYTVLHGARHIDRVFKGINTGRRSISPGVPVTPRELPNHLKGVPRRVRRMLGEKTQWVVAGPKYGPNRHETRRLTTLIKLERRALRKYLRDALAGLSKARVL
jgi:hypothetical protein